MKDQFASASATRWLASLALMAGTALCAPALACPPEESESDSLERGVRLRVDGPRMMLRGEGQPIRVDGQEIVVETPVAFSFNRREPESGSTMTLTRSEGDDTYEIHVKNGKATGKINGEKVPAKQVRQRNGGYELLNDEGKVVAAFPGITARGDLAEARAGSAARSLYGQLQATAPRAPGAQGGANFLRFEPGQDAVNRYEPPPVMLGITMSDASDEEGEEAGVVIDRVMDGLPAGEAGVKSGDKVLALDGKEISSVEEFREIVKTKKGGDTITLKVLRDGKDHELRVELKKFDPEVMKPLMEQTMSGWASVDELAKAGSENDAWYESAKKAIEDARRSLENESISVEQRRRAEETLEKALQSLKQAKDRAAATPFGAQGGVRAWNFEGRNAPEVYVPRPATPRGMSTERMDDLESRLNKLASRMDKTLEALEGRSADNEKLKAENAELRKKVEELERKRGGN